VYTSFSPKNTDLFSNKEFQELLNNIDPKGNKSVLDKILQLFKNILCTVRFGWLETIDD
jgi:hypothetical protein